MSLLSEATATLAVQVADQVADQFMVSGFAKVAHFKGTEEKVFTEKGNYSFWT